MNIKHGKNVTYFIWTVWNSFEPVVRNLNSSQFVSVWNTEKNFRSLTYQTEKTMIIFTCFSKL